MGQGKTGEIKKYFEINENENIKTCEMQQMFKGKLTALNAQAVDLI